jgi:uncharacterized protein (TIGR03083 family)
MDTQEIIENLERVWHAIDALCSRFTEREWKLLTDCPGWSVQDHIAHIVDFESRFLGRPVPEHAPRSLSHLKNDLGKRNEIYVDWCRSWSGSQVLEAFREVTAERLRVLRTMRDEDFAAQSPVSLRDESLRDHLQRRIIDCWVHEQDIRRAVGHPGHYEGPVIEHALGRMAMAMAPVVGKRVGAPDGTIVVFVLTGAYNRHIALRVEGERAIALDTSPDGPTVRLTMAAETFACLGYGRWAPGATLEAGRVQLEGDTALGQAIVAQMNVTP